MKEIFLGEIIKKRRLELGLTQEQLCEGICEPITISRMENGKQTPSRNRINAILERLGLPGERYYALLSKNEEKIENLRKELLSYTILLERSMEPEKTKLLKKTQAKAQELEDISEPDDRITRQFILSCKVIIWKEEGICSLEDELKLALKALRLTVPNFDLEEINKSLYCLEEVSIINQIAGIYSRMENNRKAADIYGQLLKYIQKHYQNITQSAGHLPLIAHNYACTLDICGRYEEAIEIAELGWQSCIKYGHYQFLPGIIHILAECYYFLGNEAKSKDLFYQSYYLYKTIDNKRNLHLLQEDAKKYHNIIFENQ